MFISFFPGIVSFDASSQLAQALAHRFQDAHWLMLAASVGLVWCAQVVAAPADGPRPERA